MRLFSSASRFTLSASVIALGAAWASPAFAQPTPQNPVTPTEAEQCSKLTNPQEQALCLQAQTQPEGSANQSGDIATLPPQQVEKNKAESNAIVVTGSRIRTSPYTSPDPITVINPDLEIKGGASSTAELLQENPVAAGSFQITDVISAGNFVNNGGPGVETISLRGLGASRTLVLVNGRRAGPAGTRGAIDGFDLNVLPSTIIQTIDILKTGASSIYGSDAVAGVVNIHTKTATDGLVVRGFSSVPFESGGGSYDVSGAYGKEFSRGHVLIAGDFTHRDRLKQSDRDYLNCSTENLFDSDGNRHDVVDPRTGKGRCVGSIQNMLLFQDVGFGLPTTPNGNPFDVVQFNNPGNNLDQFLPPVNDPEIGFTAPPGFFGLPDFCQTVNPATGAPRAATPADFALCNTALGLENQFSTVDSNADVSPKLNRYTIWADASYELTDNIEAYTELLYNRRKTDFVGSRQLFFTMFPSNSDFTIRQGQVVGLPFFFCNPSVNNCNPFEAGDPFNQFTGVTVFDPVVEIPTGNKTDVKYTRGVGGLRGNFGSNFLAGNWHYDAYVQYSHSDGDYTNDIVFQDAVDSQELRTHSCAGTVTHIRGVPCIDINWTDPRILAGNFTDAEKAFLFGTDTGNTTYNQLTGEASVSGDVVNLPAGPVGLALGVQWRRDSIDDTPGPITAAGNVWGSSVSDPTRGHSLTKEAFGEIQVPLIHNTPFIQNLNFSGAARLTDVSATRKSDGLSDSSNGNWTYKLGLNWQTNEWLRFRATMGTSYRAPALFEQFLGNTTSFPSQLSIDPCINWGRALAQNSLSQRVADNCASLGIPATYGGAGSSAVAVSGGGIGVLTPETSRAKTFSVVLTPLEGLWSGNRFSVAVDYFDIKVKGEISQLGPANIVATCLNSPDFPNDPTCALFDRAPAGAANQFNITQVRDKFINISEERNRGVDLTAQMTQDFGGLGKFAALAQMTWSIEDNTTLFAGSQTSAEGTAGEPKWVGNFKFTWDKGPWSLFWGLDVIGGTSDEQNLRDFLGGTLCIHSGLRNAEVCPIYRLDPQFYHNVSITRNIGDRYRFIVGVSNLFNSKPPLVSNADAVISSVGNAPIFGTQYDLIGRRAFVSIEAKF
jgi:iron complex outermembrane recepter protein